MATKSFSVTVREIASWVSGELHGDGDKVISGIGSLGSAGPDQISFVRDDVAAGEAASGHPGALIVHRALEDVACPQIVTGDPSRAFVTVLERYQEVTTPRPDGISGHAAVSDEARIGRNVAIGAFCVVEDGAVIGDDVIIYPRVYIGHGVTIGARTLVYPQVVVREFVSIGERCIIHSGSVIGDDGFGYIQRDGRHVKLPQVGCVVIGDDVEIGSIVTIDRAALDETRIGNGVKIDNHSHIAHNVRIGENSMLIAYAKLAGSAQIGRNVMIAEDVGITDHAKIGDGAVIGGGSKVYRNLKPGDVVWGCPARPVNQEKRVQAMVGRLPQLRDKVRALEARIAALEALRGAEGREDQPSG